jgi:hypothetical protein
MKSRIGYNRHIKLAGVGPSVWAKLGPERWFDNYKVVCANARGYQADYVIDLGMHADDLESLTTQSIVDTDAFQALAGNQMSDYRFVVYKPVKIPPKLSQDRFIANHSSYKRYENKRIFRETFAGKLPIPEHRIVPFVEFFSQDAGQTYRAFSGEFGQSFVVQDELNGGGRGTFIIRSEDDMQRAMTVLQQERMGEVCIVSRFVDGIERSIQVFVSAKHAFPGPLQQQLIRHPELLNPSGRGGMFFCGGKFIYDASDKVTQQVGQIVDVVARELGASGYKGMFGIDFLVDHDESVYAIEINARTTGILPLLNEQATDLPLYLLHILELSGEPYEIAPSDSSAKIPLEGPRSFVVLFNQQDHAVYFDDTVQTGNYRVTADGVERIDGESRWNPDADFMLQLFCSGDFSAAPNLKLCNIFLKEEGFDQHGVLQESVLEKLHLLKKHIVKA